MKHLYRNIRFQPPFDRSNINAVKYSQGHLKRNIPVQCISSGGKIPKNAYKLFVLRKFNCKQMAHVTRHCPFRSTLIPDLKIFLLIFPDFPTAKERVSEQKLGGTLLLFQRDRKFYHSVQCILIKYIFHKSTYRDTCKNNLKIRYFH